MGAGTSMKTILLSVCLGFVVAGCAEEPMTQAEMDRIMEEAKSPEQKAQERRQAERKAKLNGNMETIEYPSCDKPVKKDTATKCGAKTFKVAMSECRSRSIEWAGSSAVLDEYSGDSWQERAGRGSVLDDETRLKVMSRNSDWASSTQYIAIALGNGSDGIQTYACYLDGQLRLKSVSPLGVS